MDFVAGCIGGKSVHPHLTSLLVSFERHYRVMELRGKRQSDPLVSASKHKQTDVMQLYHNIASALFRFHRVSENRRQYWQFRQYH